MPDGPANPSSPGTGNATPSPIEWAEVTDPAWQPSFTSADAGLSKAFTGPCPRCNHQTSFSVPFTRPDSAGQTVRGVPETFTMYCECGYPHPGHPDGDNSCGAYWPYEADL